MKKLLILLLLFPMLQGFAQTPITFKFKPAITAAAKAEINKSFPYDLVKNKEYYIRLENVNTAFHEIKVNPKLSNLNTSIPDILKPILPGLSSTEDVNSLIVGGGDLKSSLDPLLAAPYADSINHAYEQAYEEHKKLENFIVKTNALKMFILSNPNNSVACADEAKEYSDEFYESFKSTTGKPDRKEKLKEAILLSIHTFTGNSEAIKQLVQSQSDMIPDNITFILKNLNRYTTYLEENEPKILQQVDFLYATIDAIDHKLTIPFLVKKDLTTVQFVVLNKFTGDTIAKVNESLYTTGGFRLDFTTGFFLNSIYTNDYFLGTNSEGSKIIRREASPKFDVAVGGLAHVSYRFKSYVKVGPAIGVALSPLDVKTRYMAGIGVILGRKSQLAITGGWAFGKVKVLSGRVSEDGTTPMAVLPADLTAVPTYDRHQFGLFLGLSYNLTAK